MHLDLAMRMMADMLWTGLAVCGPVLAFTMIVGVLISVLQVVTQIQEVSLTFVPKLVVAAAALLVSGPWMLGRLMSFTTSLWAGIPAMF